LASRAGVCSSQDSTLKDRLLAFCTNIRLGRKWLTVINAPAYSAAVLIYDCKEFIAQGSRFSPIRKKTSSVVASSPKTQNNSLA